MRAIILGVILFASAPAFADDPTIDVKLPQSVWNSLLGVLGDIPLKTVAPALPAIQGIEAQGQAAIATPPDPKKEKK